MPARGAQGLIVSNGARDGGYALYVRDGRLVYENNFAGLKRETLVATQPLPAGKVEIAYAFTRDAGEGFAGGKAQLSINGQPAGEWRLQRVGPPSYQGSFDIGQVHASPVGQYAAPFRFNGAIESVTVRLD